MQIVLALTIWFLIGFVSGILEFIHQNKKILGRKELHLSDLLFSLVFGIAGPIALVTIIGCELFIVIYNKYDISMDTIVWRSKDDSQRKN